MTTPDQQIASDQPEMKTAQQYADEQRSEWSTYTAAAAIDYFGVRAYNVGDPVPVSAVEGDHAWIAERLVRRVGGDDGVTSFEGSATVVDPGPPTIDQPPADPDTTVVSSEG